MHSQIKLEIISSLQYLNCIAFAREQAQYSSLDGWPLGGCHLGGGLPPRSCADGSDWLGGRAAGPSPWVVALSGRQWQACGQLGGGQGAPAQHSPPSTMRASG